MIEEVERFTVTEEHVKLLRATYVSWWNCDFGAPCIDPKRPYGNGNVLGDMADILGVRTIDTEDGEVLAKEDAAILRLLHMETSTALQIFLRTGTMEPGTYECPRYTRKWSKVKHTEHESER